MPRTRSLPDRICETCGGTFRPRQRANASRFCSRSCFYASMHREGGPNWRGGRTRTGDGYVMVYAPEHPSITEGKRRHPYVLEHRLVMEQELGRLLEPGETVHHVNGDKHDNRPENLQLRSGRHGRGYAHRCLDCGSTNVEAVTV